MAPDRRCLISRHILLYVLATLLPLGLIGVGVVLGGYWLLSALALLTGGIPLFDALIPAIPPERLTERDQRQANRLLIALGILHFPALALALFALTGGTGLGIWGWIAAFLCFSLWFGQVSASVAHELIHRRSTLPFHLGAAIYVTILFGHHVSAHRHVHHRFAATPDDPYSADAVDTFYDYAPVAWARGFETGYELDRQMMRPRMGSKGRLIHPYLLHVTGSALVLFAAMLAFGIFGLLAALMLAVAAQAQILLSDYVHHYGLIRAKRADGRYEALNARHAWNARQVFSGHMLLQSVRHSDHHLHPERRYPLLRLPMDGRVPILPYSMQVMSALALVPPLWERVMGPALRAHQTTLARMQAASRHPTPPRAHPANLTARRTPPPKTRRLA